MSLYSSIEVPFAKDGSAKKPSGFVPLYAESSAQVSEDHVYDERQDSIASSEGKSNAALQFAPPTRRKPAIPARKKPTPIEAQGVLHTPLIGDELPNTSEIRTASPTLEQNVPRLDVINTFEDFADYQPDFEHVGESRKRQKRHKKRTTIPALPDWQDEYDPCQPVDFEIYLQSTCRKNDRQAWIVEQQRLGLCSPSSRQSKTTDPKPDLNESAQQGRKSKLNFAPIISANVHRAPSSPSPSPPPPQQDESNSKYMKPVSNLQPRPPPPPPPPMDPPSWSTTTQPSPMIESAEEAYQRRAALSARPFTTHIQSAHQDSMSGPYGLAIHSPRISHQTATAPAQTTYTASPTYNDIALKTSISDSADPAIAEVDVQTNLGPQVTQSEIRSSAPGQKGFAARYMASQGWKRGQGLGSTGAGRLAPLFVKPQKDGKTGKIIDRQKQSMHGQPSGTSMTRIVLLEGMIEIGAIVDEYLQQDVGESCSEAYGKVERVVLENTTGRVFVKFAQAISALRCTSTVEGRQYDGKHVSARYYPEEAFEKGDWSQ